MIAVKGSPRYARQFLQGNLVDEFCLTVTNGNLASATRVLHELGVKLFLADSFEVDGTLFTKWRRGNE
jgi:riboflavin biosynthesis pyrimidine reductase